MPILFQIFQLGKEETNTNQGKETPLPSPLSFIRLVEYFAQSFCFSLFPFTLSSIVYSSCFAERFRTH